MRNKQVQGVALMSHCRRQQPAASAASAAAEKEQMAASLRKAEGSLASSQSQCRSLQQQVCPGWLYV